ETRKHAIEGSLLIRELVRKSRIELDADRCTSGLAFGSSESLGIGIESNHFDIRMKPLNLCGQCPRAAANLEDVVTCAKCRLIDQHLPGCFTAQQFHNGIVERQQPISPRRRKI